VTVPVAPLILDAAASPAVAQGIEMRAPKVGEPEMAEGMGEPVSRTKSTEHLRRRATSSTRKHSQSSVSASLAIAWSRAAMAPRSARSRSARGRRAAAGTSAKQVTPRAGLHHADLRPARCDHNYRS
jgi:hypothetical protein